MRDELKRARVRRMLRAKRWQAASDRVIAGEAGVGRFLVRSVRAELIGAGLVGPPPAQPQNGYTEEQAAASYRPGASASGGYVFDESGKVVPKGVWERRQRAKKGKGR
jgi:hypothetical protein